MSEPLHTPLSSVEDDYRNSVEGNLHEFLDELCSVAIQSRSSISSKWENYLKYVKGNQWPSNLPDYKSDFTLNLVEATIKRKAAYLTDTKPIIDIIPRDHSLQPVAEILQMLVRGIWDERAVLAALTRCLYMAQIFGAGPMNLIWDDDLDFGKGEVNFIPLDPRHFLMDPGVVAAEDLQQAEYIILEGLYPLNLLKSLYPKEAPYIKADPKYSKYSTYVSTAEESLLVPSSRSIRRPLKTGNVNLSDSSIPRAIAQEFWIKDRVLLKDLPEKTQKLINAQLESKGLTPKSPEDRVWPGGRHIIRAGGKILKDESNPYFDLQMSCELLSWGMAIDHPWGKSEVEEIMNINTIINKIGASMVENTLLMNNSVWIGDSNALLPEQWERLANKPGLTVKKRPGSQLERVPAPALPGSTFALQQWLVQMMQDVTGMQDVLQGKAGNQTTGVAIEALQCVTPDTQCLTKAGWKYYHELSLEDFLYSFDPETKVGKWAKLLQINTGYRNEDIWELKAKNIDALVTDNHDWYVESYVTKKIEKLKTSQLTSEHSIPCGLPLVVNDNKDYSDPFLQLLGWIVTDGHYSENTRVKITQSYKVNLDLCNKIENILKELHYTYSFYDSKRDGVRIFTINTPYSKKIIEQFPDKRPGYGLISSLSGRQLKILAEVMLKGDGRHFAFNRPHPQVSTEYFSSDRELAEQFQAIICLAGYGSSLKETPYESMKHKGFYKGVHCNERYKNPIRVTCKSSPHISIRGLADSFGINKVPYNGLVWCPTTETGTWLARRSGKTFFTGNSQSQALLRLQARTMEVFLERLGQKLISRILQFYCESEDVECLTKRGWKKHFELTPEDEIYTLNTETDEGEWNKIEKINTFDCINEELYEIKNSRISALVTPNHTWYVLNGSKNGRWANNQKYKKVSTSDLSKHHAIPSRVPPKLKIDSPYSDEFVRLVGWIVTEGYYLSTKYKNKTYPPTRIAIVQSWQNSKYCQEIEDCLQLLGCHFRIQENITNGSSSFNLSGEMARKIIAMFPEKILTYEFISSLSTNQLSILHGVMLRGDGRYLKKIKHWDFFSADRRLLEQFQAISVLIGNGTSISKHTSGKVATVHKAPQYGDVMRVSVKKEKSITLDSLFENGQIKKVLYTGKVWCPTTKNGTWLARRDGITYYTGNSSEKIINIVGPDPKLLSFEFHRDEVLSKMKGLDPRTAFQDFIFKIEPLSSLTMSKMQKLVSMSNLYSMGLVPGSEVLKAAQIQDPEGTLEKARIDQAAKMAPAGSPIKPDAPDPSSQKPGPGGQ